MRLRDRRGAHLRVTGCGCATVVALIAAFLVLLIRGSFDAGDPIESPSP